MKRIWGYALAAIMGVSTLTGCGSGKTAATTAASTAAAADQTTTADTSKAPEPAADPSGKVVIYTGSGPEITEPIYALWKEKYPDIEIEEVKSGTGELLARISAEKDNPGGDVLWGGDTFLYLSNPDLFEAYDSKEDAEMITRDPDHKWHSYVIMPQTILVNTKLIKSEADYPKTLKELTDPKWKKAKIALADPSKSGTGLSLVKGMASLYDWDYMQQLLINTEVYPSSDAMFAAVKDATNPVGFINEDLGYKWEMSGEPVKIIYPEDGVTYNVEATGIIKGAKNMDNAKLFLDFILSRDVHKVLQDVVKRRSARTDMAPPEGLGDLSSYKLIESKFNSKDEVLDNFTKALDAARK
ncbi:ABC transporter substrate-binding protein [Lacrimispora sp.]|jgi:iron(III) transport system substrate-binding protein|uniref:ABC transporter substrate-binding protein n=1 Tax=Lacrimispora sp. TaxID=2719234 RepID=UPI0028B090E1|nr:ABC transporter substrate-binding protein [Lacrimispora sp.]